MRVRGIGDGDDDTMFRPSAAETAAGQQLLDFKLATGTSQCFLIGPR
jgi:hypothetical protein